MNQREMINKCKEKGLEVTAPLLYRQGKKNGFLIRNKSDGRERYDVDEKKFEEWLSKVEVSSDYIPVGSSARKNNMSYNALKYQLERNHCELKKMSLVHGGVMYARREDVERAVHSYCRRDKKEK